MLLSGGRKNKRTESKEWLSDFNLNKTGMKLGRAGADQSQQRDVPKAEIPVVIFLLGLVWVLFLTFFFFLMKGKVQNTIKADIM